MAATNGDEHVVPDPRLIDGEERCYQPQHRGGYETSHLFWYEAGYTSGLQDGRKQGVLGCMAILFVVLIVWAALSFPP